ncbi:MAG TPA: hypothetical protein ENJ77_01000 [Candidatus Moranbacteria bacterium]|nr:hypothetical protein [Candidatus Moranbacteria bacterium]
METILLLFGFFLVLALVSALALGGQRILEEWDRMERDDWGASALPDWYWNWGRDVPAWTFAVGIWGAALTLWLLASLASKGG